MEVVRLELAELAAEVLAELTVVQELLAQLTQAGVVVVEAEQMELAVWLVAAVLVLLLSLTPERK
jgi:hypothetical protein